MTVEPAQNPAAGATPFTTPAGLTRVALDSMGTTVECLLPADRSDAADLVRGIFADWHARLTRFDAESELSRLNARAGREAVVSPFLFDVVSRALRAAAATDGLFDPTLLHELERLGYDRTFGLVLPDGPELPPSPASPRPGGAWRSVRLDPTRLAVRLPEGVGIDLGGVAKGMAVDASIVELARIGATPAAVNAGGDLAVAGAPAGAAAWQIAIELPAGERIVSLRHGAVATSAISRRWWRRGDRRLHHLLDPRTAQPIENGLWSVSVAAERCEQAEVAAKAAFVLGLERGRDFLEAHGLPGLFVGLDGRQTEAGPWLEEAAS